MKIDIKENKQEKTIEVTIVLDLDAPLEYPQGPDFPAVRPPGAKTYKGPHIRQLVESKGYKLGECIQSSGRLSNTSDKMLKGFYIFKNETLTSKQKSDNIGEAPKKASRSKKQKK